MELSSKQAEIISAPYLHTIDWLEGTPRSGKTTAAILRFTRHLITTKDTTHLVVGYSAEQAYRLVMDADGFGLIHTFRGRSRVSHDDSGAHLVIQMPDGIKKVYWKGGDILLQRVQFIDKSWDYHGLWAEMFPVGVQMVVEAIGIIERGEAEWSPQDERFATFEPSWDRPRLKRNDLIQIGTA